VLKAIIIVVLVVAVLLGGLLALRRSGRTGMPDEAVLQRAAKRAREQAAEEDKDGR
jgi:cytochrome c-type biogenesis protein CcmH/NrfG